MYFEFDDTNSSLIEQDNFSFLAFRTFSVFIEQGLLVRIHRIPL